MKRFVFFAFLTVFAACLLGGCAKNDPEKALSRAREAAVAGNWREAFAISEKLESSFPQNIRVLLMLAVSADQCGETDRAIDAARRAVLLDGKSFAAQYTLGRIYSRIPERRNEALQILAKAYGLKKDDPGTLILMCNTAKAAGNKNYESYLKLLASLDYQQLPVVRNNLGVIAAARGELTQAQKDFAAANAQKEPRAILNIAKLFDYYRRDPQTAIIFYNQFLRAVAGNQDFAGDKAETEQRLKQLRSRR